MTEVRRINHIQSLRGLAALLVAISHAGKELLTRGSVDHYGILGLLLTWQFGVDLFFVISGFIMYHVSVGRPMGWAAAAQFTKKRLIRVVPLYWIYSLGVLVPMTFATGMMRHSGFTLPYIISSFLFIPWLRPGSDGGIAPLLAIGWTLNYEMLFYLVFAVLIGFRSRRIVLILALTFGIAVFAGGKVGFDHPQVWYWTRSIILEFVFGVAIAFMFHRRFTLPSWAGIGTVVAGIAVWQVAAMWPVTDPVINVRGFTLGIAAALMVTGASLTPIIVSVLEFGGSKGFLQRIGDASYSLYLCHMFVVRATTLTIGRYLLSTGAGAALYLLITIALCIGAAMLSHRYLEVPLIRMARRDTAPRTAGPAKKHMLP